MFDIRVSIGAVLIDQRASGASEVLAQADLACGLAKSRGRNQAHVSDPSDTAKAEMVSNVNWSRKINEALEHDRFALLFQPIVRINDGVVDHYEVLLRMRAENDALIAPGAFLPAAERFGLVHAIDRWVVEQAIARLAERHRAGERYSFSINLSGRAFEDPELLPTIGRALEASGLDPAALTFEITETAAISHMVDAKNFIEHLKALNCRFALDDFGSGFSSYGYLKFLPADYLKIDGGFVQNLARDPVDQAIVQSMNQVAHALGKQTIAECVEDEKTLRLLKAYGVDYAQGYYLGRPAPDIGRRLKARLRQRCSRDHALRRARPADAGYRRCRLAPCSWLLPSCSTATPLRDHARSSIRARSGAIMMGTAPISRVRAPHARGEYDLLHTAPHSPATPSGGAWSLVRTRTTSPACCWCRSMPLPRIVELRGRSGRAGRGHFAGRTIAARRRLDPARRRFSYVARERAGRGPRPGRSSRGVPADLPFHARGRPPLAAGAGGIAQGAGHGLPGASAPRRHGHRATAPGVARLPPPRGRAAVLPRP